MTVEFEERCRHGSDECPSSNEAIPPQKPDLIANEEAVESTIDRAASLKEPSDVFIVLGKKDSPSGLPMATKLLHIGHSPSRALIEAVAKACPPIETIRFPASLFERYIQQNTSVARLLREKGIKVISGEPQTKGSNKVWRKKRKFLLNLDSYQEGVLENADRLGLPEARIAREYFCPEDPRLRESLAKISSENGLSLGNARSRIVGLLEFLNYPTKGKLARTRARRFEERYRRALREERKRQKRTRYSEFQPVPKGMPIKIWEQFLAFTRIKKKEPDKLRSLSQRTQQILNLHYGLEDGIYRTAEEVNEILGLGITRSAITCIERQALKQLGVEKEEKKKKVISERASVEPEGYCKHKMPIEWCADCKTQEESPPKGPE